MCTCSNSCKCEKPRFADAKVGDKVYCLLHGEGEIRSVKPTHNTEYTLMIRFLNGQDDSYTVDGFFNRTFKTPTLYWSKPEIKEAPKPVWIPEKGEVVWVKSYGSSRYVLRVSLGQLNNSGALLCRQEWDFNASHPWPIWKPYVKGEAP